MASNSSAKPQGVSRLGTTGYEARDANVAWIFGLVLFLFASGIGIHFILAWMQSGFRKTAPPRDQWTRAGAAPTRAESATAQAPSLTQAPGFETPAPPPFPRLQVSPNLDLQTFRAREEATLNTYGWIDKKAGVVRIPIDQAMALLLKKGLPMRSNSHQTPLGPSSLQLQQQRAQGRAQDQP